MEKEFYKRDFLQSRLITFLRFPLLAGVVVIHGVIVSAIVRQGGGNIDLPMAMFTESLLSRSICGICVPLFFFISGYLFFLKCDEFGWKLYKEKLSKRFHSLFIPYVIYTCIAIALFGILQVLIPQLQSGAHVPIKDWSIWDFVHNGLWRYGDEGIPFIGPFWFLRNLMVIVVFFSISLLVHKIYSFLWNRITWHTLLLENMDLWNTWYFRSILFQFWGVLFNNQKGFHFVVTTMYQRQLDSCSLILC